MNPHLKQTRILLVLLLLLPAILFSVYEISSLNSYEKEIQEIYSRQLDAILSSVNQFSVDVMDSRAGRLESVLSLRTSELEPSVRGIMSETPSFQAVFISDNRKLNIITQDSTSQNPIAGRNSIETILKKNEGLVNRLFSYKREGYRKIEVLEAGVPEDYVILLFAPRNNNSICGFIIDPQVFIRQTLSPRLQEITQQKFIITIIDNFTRQAVYSTERNGTRSFSQIKPLWLLKNYSMHIELKGATIQQVVRGRTRFNIILLVLINAVLITGFWFVFRNIRRELELAQIKSDFVSNVSHELRTPLALINMYAETLEMGRVKSEEKKNEYYRIISNETGRLSRIVNKILSFSKMEAGKIKYHFSEINLNSVAGDLLSIYSYQLQSNGFKYSIQLCNHPLIIKADKEAVSESIINLLDNAIKYSKDEKEIIISTGSEKQNAWIEVKDRGIGISQEDIKRIFDKFYRVSTGLVHDTKGTGLGLALVRHIIDAHNGKITVDSIPGKGSAFKLYFPLLKNELSD